MNRAIFYIANNGYNIELARKSAESVARWCPDVAIYLYLVNAGDIAVLDGFDFVMPLNLDSEDIQYGGWFYTQNQAMPKILESLQSRGITRAIYLDCDTFVCDKIDDLWEILDVCDIAGAISPRRYLENIDPFIPKSFPEWNIGVNPMKVSNMTVSFWKEVANLHKLKLDYYGNDDQTPLRGMMHYFSSKRKYMRFLTLSPEWNFRFCFPCSASKTVKILHGKTSNIEEIARLANESKGFRAWPNGIKLE